MSAFLLAGLPAGQLTCIVFTYDPIFRFFVQQGRHIAPIKSEIGRIGLLPTKFHLDRLRVWVYGPKTLKIWNFAIDIIAPRGESLARILQNSQRTLCAFLAYITLPNFIFISINYKIINN